MTNTKRILSTLFVLAMVVSCRDVKFTAPAANTAGGLNCTGAACPAGTYSWFQGGYGICDKPCGGGSAVQTVECRRNSDNVGVADSFCSGTKPAASQTCNAQTCTSTYTWNTSAAWGACSKTCGTGQSIRVVICQDQAGATVNDSFCPVPKPAVSQTCNTNVCPPVATYAWSTTPGVCSKECGTGTVTDTVVCKSNDGNVVPDSQCDAATKPPVTHTCNTQACPVVYTYAWEAGAYSVCSKQCDTGVKTRSVLCKRSDGMYADASYCPAASKPVSSEPCKIKDCPTGRKVTQNMTVPPAQNALDVILVVDDSGSMKADQSKLAARMAGFLTDLDALNVDYQVCLTTTDIGYYKGSPIKWKGPETFIINKNTANKNAVFVNTINALGAEFSSDEQGIKAVNLMTRDFRSSGCMRNDSTLTTILISDENERSVGGNASWSQSQYQPLAPENYPDALIDLVKATFGANKRFIWNSIIVKPGDVACERTQDQQSSPSFFGTLYAELSNKTGGAIGSICDNDYAQNLQYIKERAVGSLPGLTMECTPIDTPVVTLNPATQTTITVTGNMIKFAPALSEGVKITATYTCP